MANTDTTPRESPVHSPADDGSLAQAVRLDPAEIRRDGYREPTPVSLEPSASLSTRDQAFWTAIRNRTNAIAFERYEAFIQRVLVEAGTQNGAPSADEGQAAVPDADAAKGERDAPGKYGEPSIAARRRDLMNRPSIRGVDAYQLLKAATEAFVVMEGGVKIRPLVRSDADEPIPDEEHYLGHPITFRAASQRLDEYLRNNLSHLPSKVLPYLDRIVASLLSTSQQVEGSPFGDTLVRGSVTSPSMCELIYSYWLEQGYVVQTIHAIALRFQNSRRGPHDPLVDLAIDPLRGLAPLLWGFIQDRERLSVARRSLEYLYAYGFTLDGKAAAGVAPVERRARFIEVFHNLLYRAAEFSRDDANLTMRADAFPLSQALKELHLELAESANNQDFELTREARIEMLIIQWFLARPEIRDFLRGRPLVPYRERWMPPVDRMKRLQGAPDVSITHFRELADCGEKLCLSVRFGDWVDAHQDQAANWARYWKETAQRYIHAYRSVTGVDLGVQGNDPQRQSQRLMQPAELLRMRSVARPEPSLPAPEPSGAAALLTAASDTPRLESARGRQRL